MRSQKKYKRNLLIAFIIVVAAGLTSVYGQTDTCNIRSCQPMQNNDLRQILGKLQQIKNATGSTVITSTVSATGNWLRGDSATAQQNKQNTLIYNIDNSGVTSVNTGATATNTGSVVTNTNNLKDSLTAQQNKLNKTLKAITGTVSVTGTVTTSEVTSTLAVTYSYVTSSGTNTVTTGARLVSICNTGSASANFNGTTLPSGACVTLPEVIGVLHPQITYDCLTSSLTVIVER